MPLVIPSLHSNWHVTITNTGGGTSATSHVAFATKNLAGLDQTIVNRVSNLFRDGLKGGYDTGWTLGPVHVVENFAGAMFAYDDATTEVGTASAADYASPAVSWILSKQTGRAGKPYRGRAYMPGVPETLVTEGGVLDATYVTNLQTLADALLVSINADAAIDYMVLLHDSSTPGALTPTQVSKLLVRNIVGTMRPRQRRR